MATSFASQRRDDSDAAASDARPHWHSDHSHCILANMNDASLSALTLRMEAPADHRTVEELTRDAFWNLHVPGCDEHYLVHVMREHADFIPELSYVAVLDGIIVGNIMTTCSWLRADGQQMPTLTVGPVTVHPDYQRRGIGRAMITRVCELGRTRGFAAIVLLGHPHNYVGYGFRNGKDLGIAMDDGSHPLGLLAMELTPGALSGGHRRVHFSKVFELPSGFDEFDASFPAREKAWRSSQELFAMALRAQLV